MPDITNKTQMYELLAKGAFGNHVRFWENSEAFIESGFRGFVGVRCAGKPGGPFYPHLSPQQAIITAVVAEASGYRPIISEFTPLDHIVFNGELVLDYYGLVLYYSRAKTHMRPALRTAKHVVGVCATALLREALSGSSYEDVMALVDAYPGHAIELTVFSGCVGVLRGRNHVIWEVRKY